MSSYLLARGLLPSPREAPAILCLLPGLAAPVASGDLLLRSDGLSLRTDLPPHLEHVAPGVFRVPLSNGTAVLALVRPWHQPVALAGLAAPGVRTLVVSAYGLMDGLWYDGPLAEIDGDGRLRHYLAAGGAGALALPNAHAPGLGHPLEAAAGLEGAEGERMHRCLLGQMRAALDAHSTSLVVRLSQADLATAIELVLLRQALGAQQVAVSPAPALAPLPAPWRRLCQNLGLHLTAPGLPTPLSLPGLASLPAGLPVAPLFAAINSISDVIPKSLSWESKPIR